MAKAETAQTTAADKSGKISEQAAVTEIPVSTAVAISGKKAVGPVDLTKLKSKRTLTMPLLQCSKAGQQVLIEILSPFFLGKKVDPKKDAAMIAEVRNLADGNRYHFIVPTVPKRELEAAYPPADGKKDENGQYVYAEGEIPGYVGKWWAIEAGQKKEMKGGNQFRDYLIDELEKVE